MIHFNVELVHSQPAPYDFDEKLKSKWYLGSFEIGLHIFTKNQVQMFHKQRHDIILNLFLTDNCMEAIHLLCCRHRLYLETRRIKTKDPKDNDKNGSRQA